MITKGFKLSALFAIFAFAAVITSCSNDDKNELPPIAQTAEQYGTKSSEVKFIKNVKKQRKTRWKIL